jgi:eukaryotic-like serine/threonine-protein kinase
MGRVYRAHDAGLDRWVALKFQRCREDAGGGHPRLEARLQARVESEHVPKVFEVGDLAGEPYFAMQFIDGPTLKAARREMTFSERLAVAVRICRALDAIHERGLVHRDVNPRNVVLRRTALDGWWPYVIDFGIARETPCADRPVDPRVLGTASYMAPEQMLGDPSRIDRRTDVYSLGATLYELFSGRRPFAAASSEAILTKALHEDPTPFALVAPTLPDRLGKIIERCLDKAPENRYATARALAADLEDCDGVTAYAFCYHSSTSVPP